MKASTLFEGKNSSLRKTFERIENKPMKKNKNWEFDFTLDTDKLPKKKKVMLDKFVKRFLKDFGETMILLGKE